MGSDIIAHENDAFHHNIISCGTFQNVYQIAELHETLARWAWHFMITLSIRHRQNATWSGVYHKVRTAGGDDGDGQVVVEANAKVDGSTPRVDDEDGINIVNSQDTDGASPSSAESGSFWVLKPSEQFLLRWYTNLQI
jgi:hypothetical protein